MRNVTMMLSCLTLAGCAGGDIELSREEQLQMTQRTYSNRSPEQVIRAAEAVLRQADPGDFTFAHNTAGFTGYRKWFETVLLASAAGTDIWNFQASSDTKQKVTKASVAIGGVQSAISHLSGIGADGGPSVPNLETQPAVYAIFWARVDYVLGIRPDWVSCATAEQSGEFKNIPGDRRKLCSTFNIGGIDARPPEIQP